MTDYKDESVEIIEEGPVQVSLPVWLVALLVLMVASTGYLLYATQMHYTELSADVMDINDQLARLDNHIEDSVATLQGQLDMTSDKLGITQADIKRARALALQNRESQRRDAARLSSELEETQDKVAATQTDVAVVQVDVQETQQTLEETMAKLESTIGDMGAQSGLIAGNRDELEALRRRGDRAYYDFDLKKSKRYKRVGEISLRLNKSDHKRQKYTLTVMTDDKKIEKKDKTLGEPVQFYLRGTRNLFEIVVFEITKNRVAGYLSTPKELEERSSN